MLRFLTGLAHAQLSITRSQSQKLACKDRITKWPKPSHFVMRPLTLQLLSAPVRAQHKRAADLLSAAPL